MRLRVAAEGIRARPAIQARLLCSARADPEFAVLALPFHVAGAAASGAARTAAYRHKFCTGIAQPLKGRDPTGAAIVCVSTHGGRHTFREIRRSIVRTGRAHRSHRRSSRRYKRTYRC